MNQSNDNNNDDDDLIIPDDCNPSNRNYTNHSENELRIIDIKLNEQEMLDIADDEHQADENEHMNMSINKEDVVLFTINTTNSNTNDGK